MASITIRTFEDDQTPDVRFRAAEHGRTMKEAREIILIHGFRTRLIADVVTGKLDVRAVAASLPEAIEIEPIDDLAEADELDDAADDSESEEVAA